jgi:hypothetical protein
MILVPLMNPKFATRLPLAMSELRVRGTSAHVPMPVVKRSKLGDFKPRRWFVTPVNVVLER